MGGSIYIDKITIGSEGDRVTLGLEDIKKIEVDLEKGGAQATLASDEVIAITPAEAVFFIHYNNIWRPI